MSGRLAMSLPDAAAASREFPVGLGGRFRPVTIQPQAASTNPVMLVEIFNGAPSGTVDGSLSNLSANRYYHIQRLSGIINQPTVQPQQTLAVGMYVVTVQTTVGNFTQRLVVTE